MAAKYPKIDQSQNSAVYIWEIYFYVNFPAIAMDSATYIREVGVPMSGIKQLDAKLENAWRQSYICIGKMAEMVGKGYPISVKESETETIYNYIQHHLKRCVENLQYEYAPDESTVNELFLLDQLAATVYPFAKPFFDGVNTPSQFFNKIKSSSLSTSEFLAPYDPRKANAKKPSKWDKPEEIAEKEEQALPDPMEGHKSLSSELNSFLDRSYFVK